MKLFKLLNYLELKKKTKNIKKIGDKICNTEFY